MSYKNFKISNGVDGIFIENTRFNTTVISVNFYLPLKKETIAANALLPYVLTSCSAEYPDYSELNLKLGMLYGADLTVSVDKVRDVQHIKFAISVINDEFSLQENESVVNSAMELLISLIFNPLKNGEALSKADTEREKRKLLEHIDSEFNDKRSFAKNKMLGIMFEDSAYGVSRYGERSYAEKITAEHLYIAWLNMLNTAYVRVQVIGKEMPQGVFEKIGKELSNYKRENITDYTVSVPLAQANSVKRVTENFDVAQGKLVMGFSSDLNGEEAVNLNVMCDIFGGGPYSFLFENVREKMSLCYYCSASCARSKGYLMVQSGVEAKNCEKAEEEILKQLDLVKNGDFSDFTFNASIKAITGSLKAYNDSPAALDRWYSGLIMRENLKTPEYLAEKISKITKQDVIDAAKGIKLHTVYRLLPKEA